MDPEDTKRCRSFPRFGKLQKNCSNPAGEDGLCIYCGISRDYTEACKIQIEAEAIYLKEMEKIPCTDRIIQPNQP
jgi:hypothetical protein